MYKWWKLGAGAGGGGGVGCVAALTVVSLDAWGPLSPPWLVL